MRTKCFWNRQCLYKTKISFRFLNKKIFSDSSTQTKKNIFGFLDPNKKNRPKQKKIIFKFLDPNKKKIFLDFSTQTKKKNMYACFGFLRSKQNNYFCPEQGIFMTKSLLLFFSWSIVFGWSIVSSAESWSWKWNKNQQEQFLHSNKNIFRFLDPNQKKYFLIPRPKQKKIFLDSSNPNKKKYF